MVRELRPDALLSAVPPFEPLGVATMQDSAPPTREPRVERLSDDAARERQPVAARLALLLDEPLAQQPVDHLLDVPLAGQRLNVSVLERAAEHGRHREHLAVRLVEPLDLLLDHLLDRLRDRVARQPHLARERERPHVVVDDAVRGDERAHELAGEERIALRRVVERAREALGDAPAPDERLDEDAVLVGRHRPEQHEREAAVAVEAVEHPNDRVAAVAGRDAVGADDERRRRAETAHDVLERFERDVGVVQVFEQQHEWVPARDARDRAGEQLEDCCAIFEAAQRRAVALRILARVARMARRSQIADLGELREEARELGREVREVRQLGRRGRALARAEVLLNHLTEPLVRKRPVLLDESTVQDADAARARESLDLFEQTALAYPGLAADDDELALAGDGGVEPVLQLGQLALAAGERDDLALVRLGAREARRGGRDRPATVVLAETATIPRERVGDLARRLRPVRRVSRDAVHGDLFELDVDVGSARGRRLRDLVDDPVEHRLDLAGERRLAEQALVEHHAEREDVGARVDLVRARHLLGTEVGDRADERARMRDPRELALERRASEPEVHDANPHAVALGRSPDHEVLGLDVAVDDALRVAVRERVGDLDADVDDLAEPQRALAQERAHVRSVDDRHDEEERALVPPDVVDGDDRGVVHLRDDLRLALEAQLRVGGEQRRRHDLDRDLSVEKRVPGAIDDAHAPAPQLADDLVPIRELRADHSPSVIGGAAWIICQERDGRENLRLSRFDSVLRIRRVEPTRSRERVDRGLAPTPCDPEPLAVASGSAVL